MAAFARAARGLELGGPEVSDDHFYFLTMHPPPPSTSNHNNLYLNLQPIQDP